MDKDLLKVLIAEVFTAVEDAEASHPFVVSILKIVGSVATSDAVLEKLIGLLSAKGIAVNSVLP